MIASFKLIQTSSIESFEYSSPMEITVSPAVPPPAVPPPAVPPPAVPPPAVPPPAVPPPAAPAPPPPPPMELTPSPSGGETFVKASNRIIADYDRIIGNMSQNISPTIRSIIDLNSRQLDNYVKKFDSFSDMIVELNDNLITNFNDNTKKQEFLDNLLNASINTGDSDTTDIEIKNDNLYFLCEYIIDYMFQKEETNSAGAITEDVTGGKRKKYTRRSNKKQINKRTRKTK
jgi:hypothetical protein